MTDITTQTAPPARTERGALGRLLRRPLALLGLALILLIVGSAIAAPWLIRSSPTGWAWLMPCSGVAMLGSLGGMALISLVVMWWPRPDRSAA